MDKIIQGGHVHMQREEDKKQKPGKSSIQKEVTKEQLAKGIRI